MKHVFDGREFEILLGSDTIDDGMYLEAQDSTDKVVQFACFYNETHRFTFTTYADGDELPFELVEMFVALARKSLPPSQSE